MWIVDTHQTPPTLTNFGKTPPVRFCCYKCKQGLGTNLLQQYCCESLFRFTLQRGYAFGSLLML